MSHAALLQAVNTHLRTTLTLPNQACDVREGGRPPASMGEFYYGIDEAGTTSNTQEYLREEFQIEVTVTIRTGKHPTDRQAAMYLTATTGMEARCRPVIAAIHRNYALMVAANALITGSVNKFQRPLFFRGSDKSQHKGADWAHGKDGQDNFLVRRLRFGGALRIQDIDIMS